VTIPPQTQSLAPEQAVDVPYRRQHSAGLQQRAFLSQDGAVPVSSQQTGLLQSATAGMLPQQTLVPSAAQDVVAGTMPHYQGAPYATMASAPSQMLQGSCVQGNMMGMHGEQLVEAPSQGMIIAPTPSGPATPGMQARLGGMQAPLSGMQVPLGGMQVPLGGMQVPPGGLQVPFGGMQVPFGGMQVPLRGMQAPPGGMQASPGGMQLPPGGMQFQPGGMQFQPGGMQVPPGGVQVSSGGMQIPPGVQVQDAQGMILQNPGAQPGVPMPGFPSQ